MKTIAIAAAALVAISTSAFAQSNRIDRREDNQERRIEQGLRSGDLTRNEARQLKAEQDRIDAMQRAAKRDGHIDRREAAQIERAQDAASRHIAQERHDSERRGSGWSDRRSSYERSGNWQRRWW